MPKKVEEEIKASLRKAHPEWSEEKVTEVTYATMNKRGMLRGKGRGTRHKSE